MATYYKYLSLGEEDKPRRDWTMDVFKNSRIYMANYVKLNDPMEAIYEIDDYIRPYITDIRDAKPNTRMCCLSKVGTDILMWAHYAESHKGCCVEFDVDLEPNSEPLEDNDTVKELCINADDLKDVVYSPHIQRPQGEILEEKIQSILHHKLSPWEYEQEIRYVKLFDYGTLNPETSVFLKVHITKVLLGCKLEMSDYEKLRQSILKVNNTIEVQQIKIKDFTSWDRDTQAHVKIFKN